MTMLLLIRHATCEQMSERLYGRTVTAPLSPVGREQAAQLAAQLSRDSLAAVYASPRERARDTASAIASPHRLPVRIAHSLDEVDYGGWSGRTFRELDRDAGWRAWNRDRESQVPPGGESIRAVQNRVLTQLRALGRLHAGSRVALVSHAEVIRSALLALRGWSASRYHEIDIAPASVTTVFAHGADLELAPVDEKVRHGSTR